MPALVGCGMSGLFANEHTSEIQKQQATMVARSCGECLEVDTEEAINTVTALSGSGPAYFFLLIEGMIKAGVELGFSEEHARSLSVQTALGAAQLASFSEHSPSELREQISSPGGTTLSALNHFSNNDFLLIVGGAVKAAHQRAQELGAK